MKHKFDKQFRAAHPETIGETDKEFDLHNYVEWLEGEYEDAMRLIIRREELREECWQKIKNGELRGSTRNERLIATANGQEDNECTIAARRLLNKKGIDWRKQNDR